MAALTYEKFELSCKNAIKAVLSNQLGLDYTDLFISSLYVRPTGRYEIKVLRWNKVTGKMEGEVFRGESENLRYADSKEYAFESMYESCYFHTKEFDGEFELENNRKIYIGSVGTIAMNALEVIVKDNATIQSEVLSELKKWGIDGDVYRFSGVQVLEDIYEYPDSSVGMVGGFYTREIALEDGEETSHIKLRFKNETTSQAVSVLCSLPTEFLDTVDNGFIEKSLTIYGRLLVEFIAGKHTVNGTRVIIALPHEKVEKPTSYEVKTIQQMAQVLITNMQDKQVLRREQQVQKWLKAPEQALVRSKLKGHRVDTNVMIYSYNLNENMVILLSVLGSAIVNKLEGQVIQHLSVTSGSSYREIIDSLNLPSTKRLQGFYEACKLN